MVVGPTLPGCAHPLTQRRIVDPSLQGICESPRFQRWDEEPGLPVDHDLAEPTDLVAATGSLARIATAATSPNDSRLEAIANTSMMA